MDTFPATQPHADATRQLLEAADIVPMAMSLVHMTGDLRVLDEIAPHVSGPWDYAHSIPAGLASGIRRRVAAQLARGSALQGVELTAETLRRMMSVAVGQPVAEEYVPMALEHMGLKGPAARAAGGAGRDWVDAVHVRGFSVIVIGAGASGLCAAIKLAEAGIPYVVLEKNAGVGGTWYENRYPGCAVDTPNHFYQYSFAPNDNWPHHYSRRASVCDYLERCATEHAVAGRVRFGREVVSAQYDEAAGHWRVEVRRSDGGMEQHVAAVVISAVGQLNRAHVPDIPGLAAFSGQAVHTSAWDESIQVAGKRVALVGTGASAIQVGPAIAPLAKGLVVLQRSGSWLARSPNVHREVGEGIKWALQNVPFYAPWYRFQLFWGFADGLFEALRIDPQWTGGSESTSALNDRYRQAMVRYMHRELEGRPDLIAKATPDYPPYGKRVLADPGWFKMLRRDNVQLLTSPIRAVEADGLRLDDGTKVEADLIVFATGFQAGRMLWPMDIRGRDGKTIRGAWGDDNPSAYLGMTVPQFPNFFVLYGPNTNLGHGGSAIFLAECQMRYVMQCLRAMVEQGIASLECRQEVHDAYNADIDRRLRSLVWSHPRVKSWYKNSTGRVITNQPWRLVDYWRLTHAPNLGDFRVEYRQSART